MLSFHKTEKTDKDSLKINRNTGRIKAILNILKFQDADTLAYMAYCPSLDITGYGETNEQAIQTMNISLEEMFKEIINYPAKQMEIFLRDLGWKHNPILNKVYSRSYVDHNGELQNFNAMDGKVERLTLEAV